MRYNFCLGDTTVNWKYYITFLLANFSSYKLIEEERLDVGSSCFFKKISLVRRFSSYIYIVEKKNNKKKNKKKQKKNKQTKKQKNRKTFIENLSSLQILSNFWKFLKPTFYVLRLRSNNIMEKNQEIANNIVALYFTN